MYAGVGKRAQARNHSKKVKEGWSAAHSYHGVGQAVPQGGLGVAKTLKP